MQMRVRDYLKEVNGDVTFIKVDIEKDVNGFYSDIYRTTPIRAAWEWEESTGELLDMIVVNKDCPPIDINGVHYMHYKKGWLKCCMVESEETIRARYSEHQAKDMIDYYEQTVK